MSKTEVERCGKCLIARGEILLKLKDLDESERALLSHYYCEVAGICEDCLFLAKDTILSGLLRQIDLLVERKAHGYKDREDFILDAIRRRLEEIKREELV